MSGSMSFSTGLLLLYLHQLPMLCIFLVFCLTSKKFAAAYTKQPSSFEMHFGFAIDYRIMKWEQILPVCERHSLKCGQYVTSFSSL